MRNMKKTLITIFAIILIAGTATGAWAYYYYNVEKVNNYYLITYTPPYERESIFGEIEYTKPEFEYKALLNYSSDESAIKAQTKEAKHRYTWLLQELERELKHPTEKELILQKAKVDAITSALQEERILIRITHIRNFDSEEAFKMICDHWADKTLSNYAKSKKIDVAVYEISKI